MERNTLRVKLLNIPKKLLSFYKSRSLFGKIAAVLFFIAASIGFGFCLLIALVWTGALGRLPDKEELKLVENPLATEVYSADSVLLGRYFVQERSDIRYEDIPQSVLDAVVATEDVRFFEHSGIDTKSLLRVLVKSILLQKESSGGGSTITQQLAKNLYPRKSYVFLSLPINKIREVIVAKRFESLYDKKALLTLYLNTVPFGDNTYGLETASQRFFSVKARDLSIDQGAVLVGMLKASQYYNPRLYPERSKTRRNVVMAQMAKYNYISQAKKDSLQRLPLKLTYNQITHHTGLAPYFREYIRPQLVEWCKVNKKANGKPYNLYTDGLKIYTTIDSRLQLYAEESMRKQMASLQKQFDAHWGKNKPWVSNVSILQEAIKRSPRFKTLLKNGLNEDEARHAMSKPTATTLFTWNGPKEVSMSPIDSIKYYLGFLHAGIMAMDPSNGAIKVWVGGIDHNFFQYDHVRLSTKRQVGSTFKPIVYAAALERGARPCDYVSAERTTYKNHDQWSPKNTEDNYDLKYSLEGALAYSVNTVSVKVLEHAGIQNTISLAQSMGIESTLLPVPSLALGTANVSMLEMVKAYACFANSGKLVSQHFITAITTHRNQILEQFAPSKESQQVLSEETAQLMVHMLKRTINEGTGSRLRTQYGLTNDIAGKTGTTQSNADGWFMAITPKLVMGSWVGADDPRIRFKTTSLGQGSNTALPIIAGLLQQANKDPDLRTITNATFPPLPPSLADEVSCDLYKSDLNVFQRIFGKKEKERKRVFGDKEEKKGFFKKLFGKN